jgi:hypothetical protein
MAKLGRAIVEVMVADFGAEEVLRRLSDPFWFQSFGAVLGMDWHSSGITTSVMGALKTSLNPISHDLGLFVCGGRGRHSRQTPNELVQIADREGLRGAELVRSSRLSAKIDNTALQDGFQLYLHSFVVTKSGEWTVIQQGMSDASATARRYHWHSLNIKSFIEEPHSSIYGENMGQILNLVHKDAARSRQGILDLAREEPIRITQEIKHLNMPAHHDVQVKDIDLKRLGAVLYLAHESGISGFEDLLLTRGLGPRTLQSLALVSEVIYGTPTRFSDPARFSFAHGGKDGHPFPVPLKVYDETIKVLNDCLSKAKVDISEKKHSFRKLHTIAKSLESDLNPDSGKFQDLIEWERANSPKYGGRTVFDDKRIRQNKGTDSGESVRRNNQLELF